MFQLLQVGHQCTIISWFFLGDFILMFEHSTKFDKALCFSRFDTSLWLAPGSEHPFELDGRRWASAEHYYQANKYAPGEHFEAIAQAPHSAEAYKLGNRWWKRKRKQFKQLRPVLMTRALYTKVCTYPELAQQLLATDDRLIAETSQYGHFWGIGRDQRGQNQLGKIWMNIRTKLRSGAEGTSGE